MYAMIRNPITNELGPIVRRIDDGANIPPDPNNRDFAAYLEWVAEGNTATEWEPPGLE